MLKNWLFLIFWAGLIFFFSHQPNLRSGLPNVWDFAFRKAAHFIEYFVLTYLSFRAFGKNNLRTLADAMLFSVIYAFSDEYHQSFILGREASLKDIGIDSLGITFAVWLIKKKMIK